MSWRIDAVSLSPARALDNEGEVAYTFLTPSRHPGSRKFRTHWGAERVARQLWKLSRRRSTGRDNYMEFRVVPWDSERS
jgi:hypothetical protein